MLWKSRWSGGCPLRRVVDRPNCARIQDNQILISAYHEILSWTYIHSRLRLVNFPSPSFPKLDLYSQPSTMVNFPSLPEFPPSFPDLINDIIRPRSKNRNRCHESTSRTTGRQSRPGRR